MSGIAATLQHKRDLKSGIGTISKAVRYLGQDYDTLREEWLGYGRLFEDETFPATYSALGFKDLGPSSPKVRGVTWMRPTVNMLRLSIVMINIQLGVLLVKRVSPPF